MRDATDIHVAQAAIFGNADLLCTQDADFFDEITKSYLDRLGVRVVSDLELLELLNRQGGVH